jgi:DNA-binding SARP family transcriptional activator
VTGAGDPAGSTHYQLQLLGSFRLQGGGKALPIRASEQRVLALLALQGSTSRAAVADQLWPDSEYERARACLRSTLSRLRMDAAGSVQHDCDTLSLAAADVDFHSAVAWAETALSVDGGWAPQLPPVSLERDLLPGWSEGWIIQARERLRLLNLCALEQVAGRLAAQNRLGLASSLAKTAVRLDPLRETAARALIEIHLREGNTAAALAEYRRLEKLLLEETGTPPNPSLTSLMAGLAGPARYATFQGHSGANRRSRTSPPGGLQRPA